MTCSSKSIGYAKAAISIVILVSGLHHHAKTTFVQCLNLMDCKDSRFRELIGSIQVKFREVRKTGVGLDVKHAPIVTA